MCCQEEANNWKGNKLSKLKLGHKPILHNFQAESGFDLPEKNFVFGVLSRCCVSPMP